MNLFGGLATCDACESRMTFRSKGAKVRADGSIVREDYLICDSYQRGRGCENGIHYNYETFERQTLLELLAHVVNDDYFAAPAAAKRLEAEIAVTARELKSVRADADGALAIAIRSKRPEAESAWNDLAARGDAVEATIASLRSDLNDANGKVPPSRIAARIGGVREQLRSEDEGVRIAARTKVAAGIGELVETMRFAAGERVVRMQLVGGQNVVVKADVVATLEDVPDEAGRFMMRDASSIVTTP